MALSLTHHSKQMFDHQNMLSGNNFPYRASLPSLMQRRDHRSDQVTKDGPEPFPKLNQIHDN